MPTVVDGVYTVEDVIAEGGMAILYRARVELSRFDYLLLYAYTQAEGATHAQRRTEADALVKRLRAHAPTLERQRQALKAQGIPVPGETVSLKVAKPGTDLERFDAEWRYLLGLNHPNLVQVYGGGLHIDRPYYAMELVEHILDPEEIVLRFSLGEKVRLVRAAGQGLAHLHENGILHRDVKPPNLVTYERTPGVYATKVSDLGIAKAMEAAEDLPSAEPDAARDGSPGETRSDQALGTRCYMAPEQVTHPREVDARADVYGLGASLYTLLAGHPPYEGLNYPDFLRAILKGERPAPIEQIAPDLPERLCRIVAKAMATDPSERYDDMPAFLAALAEVTPPAGK